ncbi:MAG: hypothetical protein V1702_03210 [Candidatus Woesearchaeota archaeon]
MATATKTLEERAITGQRETPLRFCQFQGYPDILVVEIEQKGQEPYISQLEMSLDSDLAKKIRDLIAAGKPGKLQYSILEQIPEPNWLRKLVSPEPAKDNISGRLIFEGHPYIYSFTAERPYIPYGSCVCVSKIEKLASSAKAP